MSYLCYELYFKKIMSRSIGKIIYLFIYLFILNGEKKITPELKYPSINQLKREKN